MTEEQELAVIQAEIDALFDDPQPWATRLDRRERARRYREHKAKQSREYNATHKEQRREYRRRYREEHPEKVRTQRQAAAWRKKLGIQYTTGRPRKPVVAPQTVMEPAKKGGEKDDER